MRSIIKELTENNFVVGKSHDQRLVAINFNLDVSLDITKTANGYIVRTLSSGVTEIKSFRDDSELELWLDILVEPELFSF